MTDFNGERRPDDYPVLCSPFQSMNAEYDVIVIGSGYGAGVAASRMARAGKSVAILELGWERRPGSFPHTLPQCIRDMNVSGSFEKSPSLKRLLSSNEPTRLFQLSLGEGQHAFGAHGLGGCSLINAGVFLEADEETLRMSCWPEDIRNNELSLQPYYRRAAHMLQPSICPDTHASLSKVSHIKNQSGLLREEGSFYKAPLTISFEERENNVGVTMHENLRSGHECTGLNDGSKNSTPTTYLADAWNWGTEMFCGCEVKYVKKIANATGYMVCFSWHGEGRSVFEEDFRNQLFWVRAKQFCFLGAGSLGSTEILLRSRKHGLPVSPMLGRNLSGNGDMLLFGYNGHDDINGLSGGSAKPGPTISAVIDNREHTRSKNPLAGYIIQDGCIPEPFSPLIQLMLITQTFRNAISSLIYPRHFLRATISSLKSLIMGPYCAGGAIQRTATYLIMSHDTNEITLGLKGDRPFLRGPAESHTDHAIGIREALARAIEGAGAKVGYSYFFGSGQEEVTVHLLGGANMSRNGMGCEGVTSSLGEVYTGHGEGVHQGLVCCDSSIVPTSLGVNPLATITALAERSVDLLSQKYGFTIDTTTPNGRLNSGSQAKISRQDPANSSIVKDPTMTYISIGWQFTEVLCGHIYLNSDSIDPAVSEIAGKGSCCLIKMYLTVELRRSALNSSEAPGYRGFCTGTISCSVLSHHPMRIMDGTLDLFVPSQVNADGKSMTYTLHVLSQDGVEYTIKGIKEITSDVSYSIVKAWKATTTLQLKIVRDGHVIGAGVARISLSSFQRQLRSLQPIVEFNLGLLLPLVLFLIFFISQIGLFFFRPFVPSSFSGSTETRETRTRRFPSEVLGLETADGVEVSLDFYEPCPVVNGHDASHGTDKQPILFVPGITGLQPEHSIYTLPFQRCNMLEYFSSRGCSCYVLTPRWGCNATDAEKCTVYDIRLDIAAALASISNRERKKPYVIAHCQGSVALAIGLLEGSISPFGIQGVTANSVFMHQVFGYWNAVKAASPILIRAHKYLDGNYFPIADSRINTNDKATSRTTWFQRALDVVLRLYPVSSPGEICTSTTCHRTSFAFGQLWNHKNLDRNVHDNIEKFFKGTHTELLEHVIQMGNAKQCLGEGLCPLITDRSLDNLRELPILFVSGTDNEVFKPESTLRDYEMLRRKFPATHGIHRRFLAEGYGHLDPIVGKKAAEDVYWRIYDHLKASVKES